MKLYLVCYDLIQNYFGTYNLVTFLTRLITIKNEYTHDDIKEAYRIIHQYYLHVNECMDDYILDSLSKYKEIQARCEIVLDVLNKEDERREREMDSYEIENEE